MSNLDTLTEINQERRRFVGGAALSLAAGLCLSERAQAQAALPLASPSATASFGALKQIKAGVLDVGYAEAGSADGPPVLLLHGWPYDIHSYVDVAPILARAPSSSAHRALLGMATSGLTLGSYHLRPDHMERPLPGGC